MASIINRKGLIEIQFVSPDRKRRVVRLGKIGSGAAAEIKAHIEVLVEAWRFAGDKPVDRATDKWLSKLLADKARHWLYDRMAAVGLVTARDVPEEIEAEKLGPFVDAYIASRTDLEESTGYNLKLVRGRLVEYFGSDKPIADVSPADADAWRLWLLERIGPNTTRRFCGRAKQFFRWAVRKRILAESPFQDMKGLNVQANKEREFFVDRGMAQKVLDACPNLEWQALFSLARYGGLRNPSETLLATWDDMDFERGRITVHSPKTKRYGRDTRVVPMFCELRPILEALFNEREKELGRPPSAADHIVKRYRVKGMNLRTQLERIIKRAGLSAWPKLWQNLRSSRATELASEFPAHVAAAWLGHSTLVAQKHYWQVTDGDFAKAVASPTGKATAESAAQGAEDGVVFLRSGSHEAQHAGSENPVKHGKSLQSRLPGQDLNLE